MAANETMYPGATKVYEVDVVALDNGVVGNYWSDYLARYPNATEVDSSGIGNTPYIIDANNVDHYPLLSEVDTFLASLTLNPSPSPTIPEFPMWIILPFSIGAMSLTVMILRRKANHIGIAKKSVSFDQSCAFCVKAVVDYRKS